MSVFDEEYFKIVFEQFYDKIYTGFFRKTSSTAISQDLAQITFIKFWEYRDSYTFDLPVELQLNRKAKQVLIDWLRKEAYQRRLIKEMKEYALDESNLNTLELTDTLRAAIDQIPPMRKKVFRLAYIDGFSHKEIAEQLNISVKTVDNHVLKALQQLRKILALYAILAVIS
ncbi:MAG: sigma-70 family RNA polymerase sigma factor [Niabella sp.]